MKPRISLLTALVLLTAGPVWSASKTYSTNFDGTEIPLSEGGAWSHTGVDWTPVVKENGVAHGTQTGTGGFDDSYAILSGFPPNQSITGKVELASSIDGSCSHEVELMLRMSDAAHSARGYECNLSFDGGYVQIVRWNGAFGDFTFLASGSYPGLKNGDVLQASINGNLIIVKINGQEVIRATDSTYTTGNPGVGFFRRECGSNSDVGFTNFTATGSDATLDTVPPAPPTNLHVSP